MGETSEGINGELSSDGIDSHLNTKSVVEGEGDELEEVDDPASLQLLKFSKQLHVTVLP